MKRLGISPPRTIGRTEVTLPVIGFDGRTSTSEPVYQNTWFDTRVIVANRPSHFFALPGPSSEPIDTSTDRGRFGHPFRRGPITTLQGPPQALEKAEPRSVNSGAQKQMRLLKKSVVSYVFGQIAGIPCHRAVQWYNGLYGRQAIPAGSVD